jgi:hypothetical protein
MSQSIRLNQVVEWHLAVFAGLAAGTVFLLSSILYVTLVKGLSPWVVLQYMASIVMGESVLPPPSDFSVVIVLVGLLVNYLLAITFAVILAFIIHRWGLLVGVIGGALFGAAIYVINLYTFTLIYPWFFALHGVPFFLLTVLFGAVAGGVYELLDYNDQPFFATPSSGGTLP